MNLQVILRGAVSLIYFIMGICLYFGRSKQIQAIMINIYNFNIDITDAAIYHYERTSGFLFLFMTFINCFFLIVNGPVLRLVADFGNFAMAVHLLVESFFFNTYTGTAAIIWIALTFMVMHLASPKKVKPSTTFTDEELEELSKTEKVANPKDTKKTK